MIKVILTVGIPASGKSSWAKLEVAKDPDNWVRINNDDIRAMTNGSKFSPEYEKIITATRNFLVKEALKRKKNVIIDNLNLNRRHFDDTVKLAKSVNVDAQIFEKLFYVELDEAISRDASREGAAQVGEEVIKKWWNKSGRTQLKFYKPRVEVLQTTTYSTEFSPLKQDEKLQEAIMCDLDGTLALIHNRSPYDAKDCDIKDLPNWPVIKTVVAHYEAGRKIIFCSGREDKYKPETIRFIEKYVTRTVGPEESGGRDRYETPIKYELFMRKSGDMRKDSIIKEEMFMKNIMDKYKVLMVLDDRDQVVDQWREIGLTCFQVAPGNF